MTLDFLSATARQSALLEHVEHRPWPAPDVPWASAQSRKDVLFALWPVERDVLARLVPRELTVDTHDGSAWLGVVPYRITHLRLRGLPPLPRVSSFPALDVVTYVTLEDRPGLWLFSLDLGSRVAAEASRRAFRLPARSAAVTIEHRGSILHVDSARPGAAFSARYRGTGDLFRPEPGTLAHFAAERYRMYTADGGRVYAAELHHPAWQMQEADAAIELNTVAPVPLREGSAHFFYAPTQDVLVWPLEQLTG